jgi:hypothetical protein
MSRASPGAAAETPVPDHNARSMHVVHVMEIGQDYVLVETTSDAGQEMLELYALRRTTPDVTRGPAACRAGGT